MKKIALFVNLLLFLSPCIATESKSITTKLELIQGSRTDHLTWKLSGRHHEEHATIKNDIRHAKVYLSGLKASISNGTYIGTLEAMYGDIYHGKFHKHICPEGHHGDDFARLRSKIRGDYSVDTSARVGRIFSLYNEITFTPSIGYGAFLQRYKMRHGHMTLRGDHPHYPGAPHFEKFHERIHGMHASNRALWLAPFADFRFTLPIISCLKLDLGYTFFYPIHYTDKQHFNHDHSSIKDTSQERSTFGHHGDAMFRWLLSERLEFALGGAFTRFEGHGGHSHLRLHGASHRTADLKKVQRTAVDYLLSISYSF